MKDQMYSNLKDRAKQRMTVPTAAVRARRIVIDLMDQQLLAPT